jgi:prepilin-type N-terminal cleavage/methylation domain-containing protein
MIRTYKRFTLVELLVVIAIIAVLMGMLLPAIFGVRTKAKEAKAKTEIKSLQTALAQYEATYGYLPCAGTGDTYLNDSDYTKVIRILQNRDPDNPNSAPGNARGIRFLDVITEQGPGNYLDPWENRYLVVLDLNYNGEIAQDNTDGPGEPVYESVAIWSRGKDEQDDHGLEDDINSWKQ